MPRLKPIQTLPSFVPAIATLWHFGEYLTWLMKERLPSVCFVMFCVDGLFVTYQLDRGMLLLPPAIDSQTRVVPAIRWPQPPGDAGRRAVVAARDPAVEEVPRQDERLRVAGPASGHGSSSRRPRPCSC